MKATTVSALAIALSTASYGFAVRAQAAVTPAAPTTAKVEPAPTPTAKAAAPTSASKTIKKSKKAKKTKKPKHATNKPV